MRVAMLSSESLHSITTGGLGVHVTELAAGLERRGHELHVITRRGEGQNDYDHIDGVHYHRIDHGLSENFVECMDFMCKAMAHKFHEVTAMIGKFELVHAHDWLAANAMKYVMDGFHMPGVLTMHSTEYGRDGNVFFDGFAQWIRDAEAAGCHNASVVISVSHFLADEVKRIYQVPERKIHVVPNGVSYHAFDGQVDPAEVKGRYGIGPMAPTIFSPGRMTLQKSFDLLVEAVPLVLGSYPETKFIMGGPGPERDAVIRKAHEMGVAGSIVFLEHVPRWQYIDLMRAVDIVAIPSVNEPFGLVALEAWAAGKPVVATLAGGPREFIWHDVNGFLVDTNAGGLAHGIGSLLADHDHCRALGHNGRQAVEDKYNWDKVAEYTHGVYDVALYG
jgi:glycosyltransferase involved in cell wall biosynthesis